MDKTLRMSLLFDFYGPLLTEKQQDIYEMYFHEDLSLGEISEQLSVSRQAVYDILKRSQLALEDFEAKLALVKKYQEQQDLLTEIAQALDELRTDLVPTGLDRISARVEMLFTKVTQILADS